MDKVVIAVATSQRVGTIREVIDLISSSQTPVTIFPHQKQLTKAHVSIKLIWRTSGSSGAPPAVTWNFFSSASLNISFNTRENSDIAVEVSYYVKEMPVWHCNRSSILKQEIGQHE